MRLLVIPFFLVFSNCVFAQTMEEQVNSLLNDFMNDHKSLLLANELTHTQWKAEDPSGISSLVFFSLDNYKRKNQGFQSKNNSLKGKWYVFNEFVVFEFKKKKYSMYALIIDNELRLVDVDQIDVLNQLMLNVAYRDGYLKEYEDAELISLINGFKINN